MTKLEEKYQKLSQIQHILKRPDTYIGSTEEEKEKLWIFDDNSSRLINKEITYVPGLYKIFDEILVNAADHYSNNPNKVNEIKVEINKEQNLLSVENNGPGIEVAKHPKENIYIPELIFGNLLTSSNYNDNQKRVTGGRNGYGAKLTNIFSKFFQVETYDVDRKLYYKQVFRNNMNIKEEPIIEQNKSMQSFTKITFVPDLTKFRLSQISDDTFALFTKRVYDIAGVTPKKLVVYLNKKKIDLSNFEDYVKLYIESNKPIEDNSDYSSSNESDGSDGSSLNDNITKKKNIVDYVYIKPHERWEVAVALSDHQFQQVSFVNSICTSKGGTHVSYYTEKLTSFIIESIKKGKKGKNLEIKPAQVKQHLWVFVNCKIENPTFDGQTKDTLTLKQSSFGSEFSLDDKYLKNVLKTGVMDHCVRIAQVKEELNLRKQLNTGVKKAGRVYGIPKLEDANNAGGKKSEQCTLVLTEGDSAKSLAMSGIEIVGRDDFGVFPLKGKLLNVRDCSTQKLLQNQEVQNIIKIMGLFVNKEYIDTKSLRYGSIMIMTDQDHDGSHIKGLIINLIQHFWPSLFRINGFIQEFITPIVKMSKGQTVESFYTLTDYKNFIKNNLNNNTKGWKIKYYKGLGTSTDKEAKEYFNEIDNNRIPFEYLNEDDEKCIDLAFSKHKVADRKDWLARFDPFNDIMDYSVETIRFKEFIDKEFIHFSNSDNIRSIPSLCDGLKPSERKVLYSCFKRNLSDEIKVAQLSGYISEHSAYHHGEASLQGTIVNMAQNYVGSNNINLLMPIGQFGTRNGGGKDHASSRYIYTNLSKITRHLFNKDDDNLLKTQVEENQKIEPLWYLPIVPLVLINGTEGIGTGWSSKIPMYNPREIAQCIKNKINGEEFPENLVPFYKGYSGTIKQESIDNFVITGNFHWNENTLIITELPIELWTKDYKILLEKMMGIEVQESTSKEKQKKGKKGNKVNKAKSNKNSNDSDNEDNKGKKKKNTTILSDFTEHHTNNRVEFRITFLDDYLYKYKNNNDLVLKDFKLITTKKISNMVCFNKDGKIQKYLNTRQIMNEFYELRMEYYILRKEYLVSVIKRDLELASNKARFITMYVNDELELKKKKRYIIVNKLYDLKFSTISSINKIVKTSLNNVKTSKDTKNKLNIESELAEINEENEDIEDLSLDNRDKEMFKVSSKEYDYLLSMPMWNMSIEKVEQLQKEKNQKQEELNILIKTKETDMWIKDLNEFLRVLDEVEEKEELERKNEISRKGNKAKRNKKKKDNNINNKDEKKKEK